MIVKLQRDLDNRDGPMLVYNQSRTFLTCVPSTLALYEKLGGKDKVYLHADVIDGRMRFGDLVEPQNW